MSRYIGNYLRVPSSEPQQASAPGIWSINEQLAYQRANVWPPARDPYYNQTVLHLSGDVAGTKETNPVTQPRTFLSDASTNNFLLAPNGDVSARPFSPYLENYSGYAPGNCYVDIASNSGFNLSDNANFTIEFWINCPATSGALWIASGWQNTSNLSWSLSWRSNNAIEFYGRQSSGGAGTIYYVNNSGDNTVLPNTWTHYAVVRNSSTISVYVNGNLINTGTINGTPAPSTNCRFFGDSLNGSQLTGYISNFRFSRSAIYTQPFTPATQPLTTTSQGASNVVFLGFNKNRFVDVANNLAFTFTSGNPAISANSPFVSLDTTSGSAYFDGSGDYLSTSTGNAIGTNAYTLECWVYFTASGDEAYFFGQITGGCPILIFQSGSLTLAKAFTSNIATVATSFTPFTWHHLVAVRNVSGNTAIFVNGSRVATGTDSTNYTTVGNYIVGGRGFDSASEWLTGYISNARFVIGSAVYDPTQTSLTIPTAPLQAITGTSLLTCQTRAPANNQGILDTSPNNFVVTRTGNVAQGSFSPFSQSGWSNYFDGNADYLSVPVNSTYALGSSNFTFEFWVNPNNASSAANIIAWGSDTQGWAALRLQLGSPYSILMSTNTSSWGINASTTGYAPVNGEWRHLAVVRNGTSVLVFENGTLIYSGSISGSLLQGSYNHIGKLQVGASTDFALNGYISNLRIIKNQALYSGTTVGVNYFTPSTAPLTATAVGHTGSGAVSSITGTVLLLTCQSNRFVDSSSTATSVTVNGNVSVQPFSPFAPTQAYVASQLGGSAYFDGSDYLSIASDQRLSWGTGDYTVEAWIYLTTAQSRIMITSGVGNFAFLTNSSRQLIVGRVGTDELIASELVPLNCWVHIAATRASNTTRIFINGISVATPTSITTNYGQNTTLIGGDPSNNLVGYMSGFRAIKGTALYTSNFIPPTTPLTSVPGTSLLLNFTGAGIVDATGKNNLETVGNSAVQTAQSRWSPGSMYFDGTADYLQSSIPLSELVFLHNGTPWTVEGWFYTGSTSTQYILSTDGASASVGLSIGLNDTSSRDIVAVIYRGVSGSWVQATSPTNSWNLNTWTYFAVTLDSSKNLTVYVNGVQVATSSGSSFAFSSSNPSYPLVVGRFQSPTPGGYFNGYISDLRVTRGYARYVTGTGANANQMVFNGTNTLAIPTRSFPLA